MAYFLLTLVLVLLLLVLFYGQIFLYLNRYKNLKALKIAAAHSHQAKEFSVAYMKVYEASEQPHIQVVFKDIEFNPPIEPSDEQYMNFNVGPLAVKNLSLEAEKLKFSAKFYGQIIQLTIPLESIRAITGQSGNGLTKGST